MLFIQNTFTNTPASPKVEVNSTFCLSLLLMWLITALLVVFPELYEGKYTTLAGLFH